MPKLYNPEPRKRCKEIKRGGERCSSYPMKDADYCYVHSFGKINNVPFWKNLTLHPIVALMLTIISLNFDIGSYFYGPSAELVQKSYDLIYEQYQTNPDKLLNKYPQGYILFYMNHTGQFRPHQSKLRNNYKLDWDMAKLVSINQEKIVILPPNIKDAVNNINFENIPITIERKINVVASPIQMSGINMVYEVLHDNGVEVICVLGYI